MYYTINSKQINFTIDDKLIKAYQSIKVSYNKYYIHNTKLEHVLKFEKVFF